MTKRHIFAPSRTLKSSVILSLVGVLVLSFVPAAIALHLHQAGRRLATGGWRLQPATRDVRRLDADPLGTRLNTDPAALAEYDQAFPKKNIPPDAFARGIRHAQSLPQLHLQSAWQELGPLYAPHANIANPNTNVRSAVAGRIRALAVDPRTCSGSACQTIYAGGASGGVWKTTNAGQTWTALTDNQIDVAIGTITLDPKDPNIIYVGTGDPDHGGVSHRGIGVLRSTDGGQSWTNLGYTQFANRAISSLIVDPRTAGTTSATLYVTTTLAHSGGAPTGGQSAFNNPYLPAMGFYYSTNGGQRWTSSNPTDAQRDRTGGMEAQDLVIDSKNPDVLYAAFDFNGVYKSLDDGVTWQPLSGDLPGNGFSYIRLALAPSDSNVVYAAYDLSQNGNGPIAIYRTRDAGASWQKLSRPPDACSGQCRGNMHLAIDPQNPNTLYEGGTANYGYLFRENRVCDTLSPLSSNCQSALMKSANAGTTWADISENGKKGPIHPDNHYILVDPNDGKVIYEAGDGGIFHSSDGGRTWNNLNRGLDTFQVEALSLGPKSRIYIGTQDNGSLMYTGSTTWKAVHDGDGGITAADPKNPKISYNSQFGATLFRNDSNGNPAKNVFIAPFWADYQKAGRGQFYEPYAVAPSSPNDLFYGTYRVWRSKMRGGVDGNHNGDATDDRKDKIDWVPISFDLSCSSRPSSGTTQCDSNANNGQGISAVGVAPRNPNIVVAATANGQVWLTRNALARVKTDHSCDPRRHSDDAAHCNLVSGVNWTRIDAGLPRRFITAVHFAPHSGTTLFVTFSGFDENTPGSPGHLFASGNSGKTWKNLTGSDKSTALPDLPFSDALVNPFNGHIYAAADFGVYQSDNQGSSWSLMRSGLPGVNVYQMQFDARTHTIVAATYGRGVWRVAAP